MDIKTFSTPGPYKAGDVFALLFTATADGAHAAGIMALTQAKFAYSPALALPDNSGQLADLQAQVAALTSQNAALQAAGTAKDASITQLTAQVTTLTKQLADALAAPLALAPNAPVLIAISDTGTLTLQSVPGTTASSFEIAPATPNGTAA